MALKLKDFSFKQAKPQEGVKLCSANTQSSVSDNRTNAMCGYGLNCGGGGGQCGYGLKCGGGGGQCSYGLNCSGS